VAASLDLAASIKGAMSLDILRCFDAVRGTDWSYSASLAKPRITPQTLICGHPAASIIGATCAAASRRKYPTCRASTYAAIAFASYRLVGSRRRSTDTGFRIPYSRVAHSRQPPKSRLVVDFPAIRLHCASQPCHAVVFDHPASTFAATKANADGATASAYWSALEVQTAGCTSTSDRDFESSLSSSPILARCFSRRQKGSYN
jgi:hypothetical protein